MALKMGMGVHMVFSIKFLVVELDATLLSCQPRVTVTYCFVYQLLSKTLTGTLHLS